MRAPIKVVLDTSCVRGTPRIALERLIEQGIEVQISGLVVHELAVHLAPKREDSLASRLRARMQFITDLTNGSPRFAPTHTPLISKLGGTTEGIYQVPFTEWHESVQEGWKQLLTGSRPDGEAEGLTEKMASYVDRTGKQFVNTVHAAGALGQMSDDELVLLERLSTELGGVLDFVHLPSPPSKNERFDAYARMHLFHAQRAYGQSVNKFPACEENDAIDMNLLQHLGDGLILATRDYRLIESVDACGTKQAPWVRAIGELLAGKIPVGPPFGSRARLERAKHRPRTGVELREVDAKFGS